MSHTGAGTNCGPSALSRAAHLAAQLSASSRPLRISRAQHWKAPVVPAIPKRSAKRDAKRDARIDSKIEPEALALSTGDVSESLLLSALPDATRFEIYSGAFASGEPVDYIHLLQNLDFKFDLRTEAGLSAFQACCTSIGRHAWSVRSLTLMHWTAWWGFGDNAWTSREDSTHFSRGPSGELIISRTVQAPLHETCRCSTSALLSQHDRSFSLDGTHAITDMQQFINALRSNDDDFNRPTLVGAAKTFSHLLQEHSSVLSKDYGLAGNECQSCIMPRLYLCGHLSSRAGHESDDIVFDSRARSRMSVASNIAVDDF